MVAYNDRFATRLQNQVVILATRTAMVKVDFPMSKSRLQDKNLYEYSHRVTSEITLGLGRSMVREKKILWLKRQYNLILCSLCTVKRGNILIVMLKLSMNYSEQDMQLDVR